MKQLAWKIIYHKYEGLEKKAVDFLSKEAGKYLIRENDLYRLYVLPCEGEGAQIEQSAFVIGMWQESATVRAYVKEQEIKEGGKPVKYFRAHTAGGLDRCVDALLPEAQDQCFCEVGLRHAFPAGDGHAPAGFLIEIFILHAHFHNLVDSLFFSFTGQRAAGAALHTGKTAGTFMKINMDPSFR